MITDSQVIAQASLQGESPVTLTAVVNQVAGPVDSLPAGAVDHAARAAVPDLEAAIKAALPAYAAGDGDLTGLITLMNASLSPDPVALSQALQLVWDSSVELATELSGQAMTGLSWGDAASLAVGIAPFGLLSPVVAEVARPLITKFLNALPAINGYPSQLEPIVEGLEAFRDGLHEGLVNGKLLDVDAYMQIYDAFSTSMRENVIIANTVIQAGMIVGMVQQVVTDVVAIAALILLLGSGPILVAVLGYLVYAMWQAGASALAHDFGKCLADMAAEPFGKLREAGVGVDFLFKLGQILGPLVLAALTFMTGLQPLGMAMSGSVKAARMARLGEVVKRMLPNVKETQKLLDVMQRLEQDRVTMLLEIATRIGGDAPAQFARLMQVENASALLEDLLALAFDLPDASRIDAVVAKVLSTLDGYSPRQMAGVNILAKNPPYPNVTGGPQYGDFSWAELIAEDGLEDAIALLVALLGTVGKRLHTNDTGLVQVITDFLYGGNKTTGACGSLNAAIDVLNKYPGSLIKFEVADIRRVIDLVAYHVESVTPDGSTVDRIILEVEVKTFTSGKGLSPEHRTQLLTQMGKDLFRHATEGDPSLEKLMWQLNPDGYADVGDEVKELLRAALQLKKGELVNAGVDFDALDEVLEQLLDDDVILNFYQTS